MNTPPSSPPGQPMGVSTPPEASPPEVQGDRRPAIDQATFQRLSELDPDGSRGFLRQVLQTYQRSLARQLDALGAAAADGDVARAGEVAHTLKSSSSSVGALVLSALCATVERQARQGDPQSLGEPLASLRAEADRVQATVRAMLDAHPGPQTA